MQHLTQQGQKSTHINYINRENAIECNTLQQLVQQQEEGNPRSHNDVA